MTNYVKHKLSLQRKLQSKHKIKDTVSAPAGAADAADVAVLESPSSPVPPSVSSVTPLPDDDASQLSDVRGEIFSQVKSLFDSFAQSLETRFSSVDSKFNQVMSASTFKVDDSYYGTLSREPFILAP